MEILHRSITKLVNIDDDTWTRFRQAFVQHHIAKGHFVLQPGQVCKHVYFVDSGLVRTFSTKEGDDRNIAFYAEGDFLTDLKSIRTNQPSDLSIQALEPARLFSVEKTRLVSLYDESRVLEAFGRRLLEILLEEQQEHAQSFNLYSAKERYLHLAEQQPALLQRLSLGHIASFLGIRRETLSRIRSQK